MLEHYTALTTDHGIAVIVPDHEPKARRRAAAWVWTNHVIDEPYADHMPEFAELMQAAQPVIWIVDTELDSGESEYKALIFFFLLDDIPDSHAWSQEWALGDSPQGG